MEETPDARLMEQFGRVAAGASFLQFMLENVIWEICEVSRVLGERLTGGMSFKQLSDTACALAGVHDPDGRNPDADFAELFRKRLAEAEQKRNRYLHSRWTTAFGGELEFLDDLMGIDGDHVRRTKYQGRQKRVTAEVLPIEDLQRAAGDIQALAMEIGWWLTERLNLTEEDLRDRWIGNMYREFMLDPEQPEP